MPVDKINSTKIFWELAGDKGEPLILVHGSWGDHHNWDMVTGELAKTFRVVTYDRRGHSQSERPPGQGSVEEDVADLIGLINHLDLSPAHIAGNSYGAGIVLKTAAKSPGLFRSMIIHEPPLFDLLKDNPSAQHALEAVNGRIRTVLELMARGHMEKGAEEFVEKIAMGAGSWGKLPEVVQKTFIYNASTWFDEMQDPQSLWIDPASLSHFTKPALLSAGSESPVYFALVIEKLMTALPNAKRITIEGAGHVPHMSHPGRYIEVVRNFIMADKNG
jgi:pimeloyl-ACP methyl ester carboxylesterase